MGHDKQRALLRYREALALGAGPSAISIMRSCGGDACGHGDNVDWPSALIRLDTLIRVNRSPDLQLQEVLYEVVEL